MAIPINILKEMVTDSGYRKLLSYVVHISLFLPWGWIGNQLTNRKFIWLALGIVFAVGLEVLQYAIPYRSFNLYDGMFNVFGVIIGQLIAWKITSRAFK